MGVDVLMSRVEGSDMIKDERFGVTNKLKCSTRKHQGKFSVIACCKEVTEAWLPRETNACSHGSLKN